MDFSTASVAVNPLNMTKRKPLNKHLRVQVLVRDNYRCRMCGRSKDEVALEVDHIRALADGGNDEIHNLATLCRDCNLGKSAYRFSDYTTISIIPENLEGDFSFFRDDKTGDFVRYHFYLYFKDNTHPGVPTGTFHHTWTISRTQFAGSANPAALTQRHREEECTRFLTDIKMQLVSEGKCLVRNEEGICKVDGKSKDYC